MAPAVKGFADRFDLRLQGAPEGISLQAVSPISGGVELVFAADAAKVMAGTNGNLIVDLALKTAPATPKKANGKAQRPAIATMPAIPFQVVEE